MSTPECLNSEFKHLVKLEKESVAAVEQEDWPLCQSLFIQRMKQIERLAQLIVNASLTENHPSFIQLKQHIALLDNDMLPLSKLHEETSSKLKAFHHSGKAVMAYSATKKLRT